MTVGVFTPYTTAQPLFGQKPTWLNNDLDVMRIQSYNLYEQIFWTVPDIFKVKFRGTNDNAVYIPSARTIIETVDRYAGVDVGLSIVDIASGAASTVDATAAIQAMKDLWKRERFKSKYDGNKLYGIMRGDWVWHVTADPSKVQGSRISITAIDPAMYFPITDETDVDSIIGCHLAAQISTDRGAQVHRLTYRKLLDDNGAPTGTITVEEAIFDIDQWELSNGRPSQIIRAVQPLPPSITALPVYHIKNFEEPGNPFGSSEIRGFEVIMGAINQVVSDEDLALALEGIGMYATDAPEPTDEDGTPIGWRIGPGRVVQTPEGTTFNRVDGVRSVVPYGDHFNRMVGALREAAATPDVAVGLVDVQIAQSGIALDLQLKPITAKVSKKNNLIVDVHTQMYFDIINGWYPAYEATTFENLSIEFTVGSAIPVDRAARFKELDTMLTGKVIDTQYYRDEVTKLGYVFPLDIQNRLDSEAAKEAANQATVLGTAGLVSNAGGR